MKSSVWKTNPVWRGSEQWLCVCVWFLDGEWSSWNFLGCWKYSISWSGWWLQGAYNYKKIYFTVCIKITTVYVFHLTEQSENCSVVSDSLQLHEPWNSPGQNTGVGSLSFLQRIFPTQGSISGLLHCRWIVYQLSHKGSPRTLEWVAYPFSSGSSQPGNLTGVSCLAGRFFTNWAIREASPSKTFIILTNWSVP